MRDMPSYLGLSRSDLAPGHTQGPATQKALSKPCITSPTQAAPGNYIRTLRHLEEAEVAEEDRRGQRDGGGATDSREHVLDGAKSIYGAVDSVATLKGRLEV